MAIILIGSASFFPSFPNDTGEDARVAEVKMLTDQRLIAMIALKDDSARVRAAAVENLTDQSLLAKIALEDKQQYGLVREAAVRKLTDQGVLAKIAAGDKRYAKGLVAYAFPRIRTAAVERLEDQAVLAQVALELTPLGSKDSYELYAGKLHRAAVSRLTEQASLAKVALSDQYASIRQIAIQKLRDQPTLANLALSDQYASIRSAAVDMLTDQTILTRIVLESTHQNIRAAAVKRITDQALLKRIVFESTDQSSRASAAGRITDQTLLSQLALEALQSSALIGVGRAAIIRVTDKVALIRLALESRSEAVRNAATQRLNDLFLSYPRSVQLPKAGHGGYNPAKDYRDMELVFSSGDQIKLETIATSPSYPGGVRLLAAGAIEDIGVLGKLTHDLDAVPKTTMASIVFAHRMAIILDLRRQIQRLALESRTGRLRIDLDAEEGPLPTYQGVSAWGESVAIWIGTDTTIFAAGSWETQAPDTITLSANHGPTVFLAAPINTKHLIDYLVTASQL